MASQTEFLELAAAPAGEAVTAQDVHSWADQLDELAGRIGSRFPRSEGRGRAVEYIRGLLSEVPRKNGWQLAEQAGHRAPFALQHLLDRAHWDAGAVRDDLCVYVVERLADPEGVLVIDETGFLKKGTRSVGVKRQYSGTAGRIENCQVGVFLGYSTPRGRAFLDRELYLPQEWAQDVGRRQQAHVPEEVTFHTKPELARRMIERALDAGVPAAFVTGDSVYGNDQGLRALLQERRVGYVLAVSAQTKPWVGGRQQRVDAVAGALTGEAWQRLSAGQGSKGPRLFDWALLRLSSQPVQGWECALLVRRSLSEPADTAYYLTFSPVGTPLERLVAVAGTRWSIESLLEEAKGQVGLDEYEVRSWHGWYRHITLALLAHAFLSRIRAAGVAPAAKKGERNAPVSQTLRRFKQQRGLCCR